MDDKQTLYVLMRTDMDSMNARKAMAQAAHAANAFAASAETAVGYREWAGSTTQSFGTTIVLAVDSKERLDDIVAEAQDKDFPASTILDPTYPLRDGRVTHFIPVVTCGYVFVTNRDNHNIRSMEGLKLHK